MKQQHLIAFGSEWYHFFVNSRGLCVSKKENGRFIFLTCLLENAKDDFSVTVTEKYLHCVCRGTDTVWYFLYDGMDWHSRKIFEKEQNQSCHQLTLLSKENFVNFFYVMTEKNEHLLIHQLLGDGATNPHVVDAISDIEFSVSTHGNGDLTLLYHNQENICGTRTFRWSKKTFDAFLPLDCGCNLQHAVLLVQKNMLHIAAYATFDRFVNILCLTKDIDTDDYKLSAVHLVSGESNGLCLYCVGDVLHVSWCENGLVMTSRMQEEGHWSSPKKFIRGLDIENLLYYIESGTERFSTYGYPQGGRIILYATHDLLESPPKSAAVAGKEKKKEGKKAASPDAKQNPDYVRRTIYAADMAALKKLLAGQNDMIVEIMKRISALERTNTPTAEELAEEPDVIDKLI